jgi:hypothetical protein
MASDSVPAALDLVGDAADDRLEQPRLLLALEDLERAEDRQAGVLKRAELAGEADKLLARHAADADGHLAGGRADGLFLGLLGDLLLAGLFADLRREITLLPDLGDRFLRVVRLDLVLDLLAGRVHCFEGKGGHVQRLRRLLIAPAGGNGLDPRAARVKNVPSHYSPCPPRDKGQSGDAGRILRPRGRASTRRAD